jgi:1-acyl-sn-glycerol-3-phosphate acyltransferase
MSAEGVTQMGWSYALGKLLFTEIARGFFDFKVVNAEALRESGGALVVSNHVSYLDPPLIGQVFDDPLHFFARKTLFRHPLIGALLRSWQAIPIDRDKPDASSLKQTIRVLRDGGKVLMFPEGTRSEDGEVKEAQPGAGLFIAKGQTAVLPVRIFGAFEAYPKGAKLPRYAPITVVVGERWMPDFEGLKGMPLKDLYKYLADESMRRVRELSL